MVEGSQIIRLVESLNLLMIDETREKYLLTHVYYFTEPDRELFKFYFIKLL